MIFEPLYSPDLGLVGFRCRCGACTRVVRTQRGAEMHCWRKHKAKMQMSMFDKERIDYEAKASAEPELVRDERKTAGASANEIVASFCDTTSDS